MITVQKYRCEFCNTEYKNQVDAQECESNHFAPIQIQKSEYNPYKYDKCGYPKSINIKMTDGKVIKYVRGGVC